MVDNQVTDFEKEKILPEQVFVFIHSKKIEF